MPLEAAVALAVEMAWRTATHPSWPTSGIMDRGVCQATLNDASVVCPAPFWPRDPTTHSSRQLRRANGEWESCRALVALALTHLASAQWCWQREWPCRCLEALTAAASTTAEHRGVEDSGGRGKEAALNRWMCGPRGFDSEARSCKQG